MRDGLLEDFHKAGIYIEGERRPASVAPSYHGGWGILLFVLVWGLTAFAGHAAFVASVRVETLERTRYTLEEAVRNRAEVIARINEIRARLDQLEVEP